MSSHQAAYESAVKSFANEISALIAARAPKIGTTPETLLRAVLGELLGEDQLADGRAHNWRVRLRLYDTMRPDEPLADSDPETRLDLPGQTVVRGLSKMLTWVADLASEYHGAPCAGLEQTTLQRKLRSLRTQMAHRGDGTGFFCAPYEVTHGGTTRHMTARVDVCRAESAHIEGTRPFRGSPPSH